MVLSSSRRHKRDLESLVRTIRASDNDAWVGLIGRFHRLLRRIQPYLHQHTDYIDRISTKGAMSCSLTDSRRFLRRNFDRLFRDLVGEPHVYTMVECLEVPTTARGDHRLASAAVIVETRSERPPPHDFEEPAQGISAACASSIPGYRETIDLAAEWLADTHVRELFAGRVITDFDKQVRRFAETSFSSNRIMRGQISVSAAENLLDRCAAPGEIRQLLLGRIETLDAREVVMHQHGSISIGDGAIINAPVTVADSIDGTFNRLEQSRVDPALVSLLRDLGRAVVGATHEAPPSVAEQMARDVETLTTELTSDAPRAPWYRLALEGLRDTATTLGGAATPVLDLIATIGPLIG
jgi:hypothetical protein